MVWRGRSTVRDVSDGVRYAIGRAPVLTDPPAGRFLAAPTVAALSPVPVGPATRPFDLASVNALRRAADDLVAHRFTFLNLRGVDVGDPIAWNRDHETGVDAPTGYSAGIDYRDAAIAGDAKLVWEPNRHLHLPVLGRAYRATGEAAYAQEALRQVESWIVQCAFGTGMNWRSPLELAIRAINWTWLLALIDPSALLRGDAARRLLHALDCHVQEIARKYSQGSSANNHRIGEAAGVFVATSCCPDLTDAGRRADRSFDILCTELLAQHQPDGGNREQAFGYHLFVLQFALIAAHVARVTQRPLPEPVRDRLSSMIDFVELVTAAGTAPMYGDADDGYVLDLGGREHGGRELVSIGRVLLDQQPPTWCEPLWWLFGIAPPAAAGAKTPRRDLRPHAFPHTGLYLLQWGAAGSSDSASLTLDCGDLGYGPLAAHGHADALAITLRAFGEDILVDPGTYDYFRYPAFREYFRSTRAHNTITVDNVDQSVMSGPFMWDARAVARACEWHADPDRAWIVAEHDGYTRLADPVLHRRRVEMDATGRRFVVTDTLECAGVHRAAACFHVSERADVERSGDHAFDIAVAGGRVRLTIDPQAHVTVLHGAEAPIAGWVSRGYHVKAPSWMIVAEVTTQGSTTITTELQICPRTV